MLIIGDLNWKDVINNPINELSDDDGSYEFSYHSSITDDDNDYDENIDFDTLYENQRTLFQMTTGMTLPDTSSNNSRSASSKNLSKNILYSSEFVFLLEINFCIHCFIADSDNEDIGFGIDEENDGDELIRFTQDKNAKKHDYIPNRTKKIRTESSVVKRPSSKNKSGKF